MGKVHCKVVGTRENMTHFLHKGMRNKSWNCTNPNISYSRKIYTECPVTFGTLSKHYFSAPNKDIKIPKDIVCRGSFAILSNVLQAK